MMQLTRNGCKQNHKKRNKGSYEGILDFLRRTLIKISNLFIDRQFTSSIFHKNSYKMKGTISDNSYYGKDIGIRHISLYGILSKPHRFSRYSATILPKVTI